MNKPGIHLLISCPLDPIPLCFGENYLNSRLDTACKTPAAVRALAVPELALEIAPPADLQQAGF